MTIDRTVAPSVSQIGDFEIMKPLRRPMNNGVMLNVIEAGNEEVVRFDLVIRGGQLIQTQPLQAFYTNRMLREGTKKYTSKEIAEKLDYYGAWLDMSSSINYGFITLYSLNKYFEYTMEVLASMIKEPAFDEDKLRIMTEAGRQNFLVNEERVDVLAHKQLISSLFGKNHPLGRFAEKEDYDKVTVDVLKAMYNQSYNSSNSIAFVSGKVTDEVVKCIEKFFGNEKWGTTDSVVEFKTFIPETDCRKRINIVKEGALQSSLKLGGFTIPRSNDDFQKFRLLVTLFGGYFGSRLMSNIREDKGYTYGISAGIISYPVENALVVSTEADNEYVLPIIDEVYHEIDRLQNELVGEKELEMVRNYMLGDICRSYEGAFSLSDAWIYSESIGSDYDFFAKSIAAIREVTVEDILRMSQKYLNKENLIEVVAGREIH